MYSSKFANLYSQGWSLTLRVSSLRECRFDLSTLPPAARHTSPPRNKFNLHVLRLACALPLPFPRQQIKFAHYYYCTAISIMWETIFAGMTCLIDIVRKSNRMVVIMQLTHRSLSSLKSRLTKHFLETLNHHFIFANCHSSPYYVLPPPPPSVTLLAI